MIVNLKSQTDLSGIYLVFNGSTNLEEKGIYGISHLMEHLLCKNIDHLNDEYDRLAIDWNAYTSENEVVFYLTGLDKIINSKKYEFADLITNFDITKEQFENERKIVLQEYEDYFNQQTYAHSLNLNRKLFNSYNPIGLKEDLESLTFMDCINFFEKQFQKPSKIINVSKKFKFVSDDFEFATPTIKNKLEYGNYDVPFETGNSFKDKSSIIMTSPIIKEDHAIVSFINSMMCMGLNSPLYQEVREKKGLVYYVSLSNDRFYQDGVNFFSTLTSNKNVDEVISTVKEVFENSDKYLTKERFNIIKESFKIRFKKNEINRFSSVSRWINPKEWNLSDVIEDITLDKVKGVYKKNFDFSKWKVSVDKKDF